MSAQAPEKKSMSGRSLFLLSFVGIAALVVVVLWFYRGVDKAKESLARSQDEYEKMSAMKRNVDGLRARSGGRKTSVAPEDGGGILGFLEKKAKDQQISSIEIRPPDRETPWTGWSEAPYQVSVRKDAGVARGSWVNFLANVERERPYLKTKQMDVTFEENGSVHGNVTISFFKQAAAPSK